MDCLHPLNMPGIGLVPCGKCVNCRVNKRSAWIYRLQKEARQYPFSLFVTLTYDDEHLHYFGNIPVVCKRDIQLFMKRIRKRYEDSGLVFRYFCVSEYGSDTARPHYHMILFGFPFGIKKSTDVLFDAWQNGFVKVELLRDSSISYVVKYMYENSFVPAALSKYKEYRNFMLCSRRPGIGASFLDDNICTFYRSNPRVIVRNSMGLPMAMPRYYKDKLYDDDMKAYLRERSAMFHVEQLPQHQRLTHEQLLDKQDRKLNYEQYKESKLKPKKNG